MDFLDFLSNLSSVNSNSNLIKDSFKSFTDSTEYPGERIKSFIAFLILVLCYIAVAFGILFLIYKFFK